MLAILSGWAIAPAIFEAAPHFPWEFYSVLAIGFVAAVSLGSVAWYNSKRPAGWEDKDRPKVIPKIDQD